MKFNELKVLAKQNNLKLHKYHVGHFTRQQYIYSKESNILDQRIIEIKKIPYTKYAYMARTNEMAENSFYKITAKDYAELLREGALEE